MTEYSLIHRNKWITADATSLPEMVLVLESAADELRAMWSTGTVHLADDGTVADDYARLVTDDPEVAARFGFARVEAGNDG